MLKTSIHSSSLLAISSFYFGVGLLCLANPRGVATLLYYFLSYGCLILSFAMFLLTMFSTASRKQKQSKYFEAILLFLFALWVYSNPINLFSLLPYMISAWGFLNVCIRSIHWYVYYNDRLQGTLRIAIETMVIAVFSILLILKPLPQAKYVLYIIGIYFILYALMYLQDFLSQVFPSEVTYKRKIALPIFMNALLPSKLVLFINTKLKEDPNERDFLSLNPKNETSNIEIFIHLGANGFDKVGHVDLCFDGIVLSYGNHDSHSTLLHGVIGDGVIYFAEKTAYLNMITYQNKKNIISFGISLNKTEQNQIKQQLLSLAKRFIPWQSDLDKKNSGLETSGNPQNYASKLTRFVRPKFFKFSHGKFKTYFIMTTNCVLLADTLIGKSSIDLITIDGMITPGTYFDFLNTEFLMNNSVVVSRTIYNSDTITQQQEDQLLQQTIIQMKDPIQFIEDNMFSKNNYED